MEGAGEYLLDLLQQILQPGYKICLSRAGLVVFSAWLTVSVCCRKLSNSDLTSLSSTTWMNVQSSITILTTHSANLSQKRDQVLCQQSQKLHQQGSAKDYATQLAQLGPTLPLLLKLLLDAQHTCSLPLLHNLTLCERAAIRLQLLISQHEPNEATKAILDLTVPAAPDVCPVRSAWQTTLAAIQVQPAPHQQHLHGLYGCCCCDASRVIC